MSGSGALASPPARLGRLVLGAGLLALAALLLLRAWIADDAYITYRVLDNLLHGYGLRWNTDERVEVFTHPLWALLHIPLGAILGDLRWASLTLSAICLAAGIGLGRRATGLAALPFALVVVLPLLLSRSFADFAISGLETPLLVLLIAACAAAALERPERPRWLALALGVSLAALTRLDALLLCAPCLLALVLARRGRVPWGPLWLGVLPWLAWEAWSLFYYGFPFSNTKYAKLDTGIAAAALASQGGAYVLEFVRHDPQSALFVALAVGLGVRALRRLVSQAGGRAQDLAVASLAAGLLAYLAYVVAIGGDFMRGRFFVPPFFLAVLLVGCEVARRPLRHGVALAAATGACWAAALVWHAGEPPEASNWRGIADERAALAPFTGLLDPRREREPADHLWARAGAELRSQVREAGARLVTQRRVVGLLGFYAGPDVIVLDTYALGDALLAHLPVTDPQRWRIGHFWRELPAGYRHARETGDTSQMDPDLRRYYEKLRLVVSGPLLSGERLREIVRFNTGRNDAWRDAYLRRLRQVRSTRPGPAP